MKASHRSGKGSTGLQRSRRLSQTGRRAVQSDPAKADAQRRIRAATICVTGFWCGVATVICYFLTLLGFLGSAIVAIGMGIWGLAALAAVGPGREDGDDVAPIERVSAKMAKRARPQGVMGIAIGAGALLLILVRFLTQNMR